MDFLVLVGFIMRVWLMLLMWRENWKGVDFLVLLNRSVGVLKCRFFVLLVYMVDIGIIWVRLSVEIGGCCIFV